MAQHNQKYTYEHNILTGEIICRYEGYPDCKGKTQAAARAKMLRLVQKRQTVDLKKLVNVIMH